MHVGKCCPHLALFCYYMQLPARPVEHTQTSLTPNITNSHLNQQKFFRIGSGFSPVFVVQTSACGCLLFPSLGGGGGLTTRRRSSTRPTLMDTLPVGLVPTHQLVMVYFHQKGTNFESCLRILSGLKPHQRAGRVEKDPCRPNQGRTPSWVCFYPFHLVLYTHFSGVCVCVCGALTGIPAELHT